MHALVEPMAKARRDYYTIRFSDGTKEALKTPPDQTQSPAGAAGDQGDAANHLRRSRAGHYKDEEFGSAPLTAAQKKRFADLEIELRSSKP